MIFCSCPGVVWFWALWVFQLFILLDAKFVSIISPSLHCLLALISVFWFYRSFLVWCDPVRLIFPCFWGLVQEVLAHSSIPKHFQYIFQYISCINFLVSDLTVIHFESHTHAAVLETETRPPRVLGHALLLKWGFCLKWGLSDLPRLTLGLHSFHMHLLSAWHCRDGPACQCLCWFL